jgi:anti-sigma28 factor (negative regulator of flagellin synthesis)
MSGGKPSAAPDDDDEDDEDDDTAPPNTRTPQDRTKPPSWEDIDKITAAMRKAARGERRMRQRVAEWREADTRRQEQLTQAQQLAEAEAKARQAAEQMFRPATIRAASVPALLRAEARADRVDALFSMIDQGSLGIDGDSVTGLDEQVEGLKTRFPEWFEKPQQQQPPQERQAPRVTTGDRPPANTEEPLTSAQRMAQQILGGNA